MTEILIYTALPFPAVLYLQDVASVDVNRLLTLITESMKLAALMNLNCAKIQINTFPHLVLTLCWSFTDSNTATT